jgi:hypothetical protein
VPKGRMAWNKIKEVLHRVDANSPPSSNNDQDLKMGLLAKRVQAHYINLDSSRNVEVQSSLVFEGFGKTKDWTTGPVRSWA